MSTYFPYSFIINLSNEIKQTVSRHAYLGDWAVAESSDQRLEAAASGIAISEIYY